MSEDQVRALAEMDDMKLELIHVMTMMRLKVIAMHTSCAN